MAYITAAQFVRVYDSRKIVQELSDSGSPVLEADLDTNANLADILGMASEMVASAALVGKRYTVAQLAALAASSDSGFLLRKLVADLAFAILVGRRGRSAADVDRLCPAHRQALLSLEQLRNGERLFPGITDGQHAEAGLPGSTDTQSPTNPNRLITFTTKASRLFPFDCRRQLSGNCGC